MDDESHQPRGRYSRGFLPHIDAEGVPQFLTWRLADSLPAALLNDWRLELENEPDETKKKELYSRIERYLDEGHGSCILRNPVAAKIVQDALIFHHEGHYQLHEWCVMPNHVHALLTPFEGKSLEQIMHAQKSYTSLQINKHLGGKGQLWQVESFDRFIRDDEMKSVLEKSNSRE